MSHCCQCNCNDEYDHEYDICDKCHEDNIYEYTEEDCSECQVVKRNCICHRFCDLCGQLDNSCYCSEMENEKEQCDMCGFIYCACGYDGEQEYNRDGNYTTCRECGDCQHFDNMEYEFDWFCERCHLYLIQIYEQFNITPEDRSAGNVGAYALKVIELFENRRYGNIEDFVKALTGVRNIMSVMSCAGSLSILPFDIIGVLIADIITPTVVD